ncbi:hypothetical protein A6A29_20300 [Streptomyces sp. TSRI0281]|nr:hypothetical protein A6A29_20300 [Streptomyces sp. TSRI0281]
MGDEGCQSRPAACAAAFHGAGRHVENASGLRDGVALHIDQDEGGALFGGQGGQGRQKLAVQILAFRRSLGGLVGFQELIQSLCVVDRRCSAGGRLAGAVEAGVDGDAVQPGRHSGLAAEGVGGPEGRHQGVLDGVSRFLPVPEGAQRHGPQPVAMAAYELTEGVRFACDVLGEQFRVAEWS